VLRGSSQCFGTTLSSERRCCSYSPSISSCKLQATSPPSMSFGSEWSVPTSVASALYPNHYPWKTCQDLRSFILGYHVWRDQAENHLQKSPVLRLSTPQLATLPLEDLKAFAIRREKLCARWERSDGNTRFVRGGLVAGLDMLQRSGSNPWILPGGNYLLVHMRGNLALHHIQWSDDLPSLSQPTTIHNLDPGTGRGRNKLLLATLPHPVLARVVGFANR